MGITYGRIEMPLSAWGSACVHLDGIGGKEELVTPALTEM